MYTIYDEKYYQKKIKRARYRDVKKTSIFE